MVEHQTYQEYRDDRATQAYGDDLMRRVISAYPLPRTPREGRIYVQNTLHAAFGYEQVAHDPWEWWPDFDPILDGDGGYP